MMDFIKLLGIEWPKLIELAFYLIDKAKELSSASGVSPEEFSRLVDRRATDRDAEIENQISAEMIALRKSHE